MSEEKKDLNENEEVEVDEGKIKIADEVVSIITGLAATEIEGVAGMSGGLVGGIADMLGRKNLSKGVKVEVNDDEALIDVYVVIDYGKSIPDVAWQIQDNVKEAVEGMTGLNVKTINVHVQGVNLPEEDEVEVETVEEAEED
ncbi:Asp23/Gls24 family envelope stress response protein [Halanaerobium sp. Z-7514]|uniref:Asp23/Gls24 family envelope stress response protein n=1 Tax=Halanaerobium polyolivorans TaxID=2886943 RepID=A0AAW4WTC1_9FIRM|nr:Asp23/Gls24 family envelope stress response protein [Halanaerobium polyolivorans]MCC3143765.1 Asp23/Gls24 family envelope stress response protein [Halanaerobium polyolivorans]RQD74158.1 MAG: Asp23/Gls24 family envelope stress response protein [Halanaerobium sp. MSAO_Bac5]